MYAILESKPLGITLTIILTLIGYSLLISGGICTSTGQLITNKTDCLNVYITGIFMAFIMSVAWLFALLAYLIDRCDPPVVHENPVRSVRKIKKKKSPLQSVVVQ
jgi:hypothetical protein